MARGARPRGQRYALERMMPRTDYEALEARRQALRDRGGTTPIKLAKTTSTSKKR